MQKYANTYLDMAEKWSSLSFDVDLKVGCLIVKSGQIIADGFNGMPSGFDNECKDENGKTKIEVLHAEENAIVKLARSPHSGKGATIYCTHSPCRKCMKLLFQIGIKSIVYRFEFKDFTTVRNLYPTVNFQQIIK